MSKKRSHKKSPVQSQRGRLLRFEHPLASLSLEERRRLARQIGREAQKRYQKLERSLDETLLHLEPVHVICLTAFTMVFGASKPSGVEQPLVLQHHAELLQALMLRHSIGEYQSIIGTPDQVQAAIDLVRDFFEARTAMPAADLPDDEEQLAREVILADMRLHTVYPFLSSRKGDRCSTARISFS